jgi:hypothetical protein
MNKKIMHFVMAGIGIILLTNAALAAESLPVKNIFDRAFLQMEQLPRDVNESFDISLDTLKAQGTLQAKIHDLSFDISPLEGDNLEVVGIANFDISVDHGFSRHRMNPN